MKEKIFSFIDNSIDIAVELQTELCKRPAVSPESEGEGELLKCEFLEGWLKQNGITDLVRYDSPDPRAKGGVRPSLLATIPGKDKNLPRFWVMSHLDVVPPGEMSLWDSDPWTVRSTGEGKDRKLIGRGVEDNQQGMVSSILAALSYIKQGLVPERDVKLLFVSDEENGSIYGIDWIIKNHPEVFKKDDLMLIPDSGSKDGAAIEIAEKNSLWLKLITRGLQAHGSRPDQGINAHLAGADFALKLFYGLSEKFSAKDPLFEPDYSTFQLTKKEANVPNINTIPGEDVFYFDMRILPCYPIKEVLKEVELIKTDIEKKHKVNIEIVVVQGKESMATSADAPLIAMLSKCIEEVYQVKTKTIGIGGGTVAAFLRNAGIDSAVWARIESSAHQPNEYSLLANLLGDAKIMALMMS